MTYAPSTSAWMRRFPTSPDISSVDRACRWPRYEAPLKDAFGPHCFYCAATLPANNPIDHVLPWSLVGIDGLANLVFACTRCNGDEGGALPTMTIVDKVLAAARIPALDEIAPSLQWPTQYSRVAAAARGIYRGQPAGVPTWSSYIRVERLYVSYALRWLRD